MTNNEIVEHLTWKFAHALAAHNAALKGIEGLKTSDQPSWNRLHLFSKAKMRTTRRRLEDTVIALQEAHERSRLP